MSLKCEPELAEQLRGSYPDDVDAGLPPEQAPLEHGAVLRRRVSDEMVRDMVEDSYDLIVAAMPRRVRERLGWEVTTA